MSTWSSRRKFLYGGSILGLILLIAVVVGFKFFYKTPTCFDGIRNGGEQDIDCGGACVKLCQSAFLPPKIMWGGGKFEKVGNGLYNLASYIVNPNTNGAAIDVPYKFTLFDAKGLPISEFEGTTIIPAHRNILVFKPAVDTGERLPSKAVFEFTAAPVWFKSHDTLGDLAIVDKQYSEDDVSSSLEVTLQNKSLFPINNILVSAVLYDEADNTIGFSKTIVDSIAPNNGRAIAPFTWSVARQGRVVTIDVLPAVMPVRD